MAAFKPTTRTLLLTKSYLFRPTLIRVHHVHTSSPKSSSVQAPVTADLLTSHHQQTTKKPPSPLAILPTLEVFRSYVITRATSSPLMLNACFAIIKRMLDPKAVLLSPERNPLLKWVFKNTFYAQFCAGENKADVQRTVAGVKNKGYNGVILELALEVLSGEGGASTTSEEIAIWRQGMLDTVDMSAAGDFIALKWSGIGKEALKHLNEGKPPTKEMHNAIIELCDLAAKKDAALLPGAELEVTNVGIDAWTLDLQRKYNKATPGKALMYTTYQAYLKSTPSRVARDLAIAEKEGFTLGVKLVRGAYLLSEPKGTCWNSKEETDNCYDAITEAVLNRKYNDVLKPADGSSSKFPEVALMLASHNAVSIEKARSIRSKQAAAGQPRIDCTYAQLQGMADEISCSLVAASREKKVEAESLKDSDRDVDVPRPYKCATWGSITQCLNFLYRRALENKDAASRTVETRDAMGKELSRRAKAVFGLE